MTTAKQENEMKVLTSGFEDFGSGATEEEAIADAVANCDITIAEIQAGIKRHEETNVLGKGLYFEDRDDGES